MVDTFSLIDAFNTGRQMRDQRMAQQEQQGLRNTQAKIGGLLSQPGATAQSGNVEQAREMALQSGSPELIGQVQQQIQQMSAQDQAAARENMQRLAGVATSALQQAQQSPDQWPQIYAQARRAAAQFGVDPSALPENATPQDVQNFVRSIGALDEQIFRSMVSPTALGANETRIDPVSGGQTVGAAGQEARAIDMGELGVRRGQLALGQAELGQRQREYTAEQERMAASQADQGNEAQEQARRISDQFARQDQIFQMIDRAVDQTGRFTAGSAEPLRRLPGTPAANLDATLDTIRANIGFQELQRMRDMSPTGGALGQVTERELALLQSVMASLDQSQSPEQLRQNLQSARDQIMGSRRRVAEAYREDFGQYPPGYEGATAQTGSFQEGATATNPQTGERIVYRNGQWEPM